MEYQRPETKILKQRINEDRKFIQVITGPRQVGKTTMIQQVLRNYNGLYTFLNLDLASANGNIQTEQAWNLARLKIKNGETNSYLIILDEIQKVKNWSELIKKEWDYDTFNGINIKLILSGSSRLLIQQGLTESLAGRFELIRATHWGYDEMKAAFNISPEQFIFFGAYPGAVTLIGDENRWREYIINALIETTISKDILHLTRIDKPALLRELFESGVAYSGQILSYNKILGQLQDAGNTTTLAHYLNILSQAGMLTGLSKYSPNKLLARSSSPKFQVYNTAVSGALSGKSYNEAVSDSKIRGRHFESAIGAHLLNSSVKQNFELYYWREGNDEVDFIIKKGDKTAAIEVKSGLKKSYGGINALRKKAGDIKGYIVGETGIPFEEFTHTSPADLL